jgi:hypothetical protein
MWPEELPPVTVDLLRRRKQVSRPHQGTGRGRPLAKMLVEQHGGTLIVTTALGPGKAVAVMIPGWRAVAGRAAYGRTAVATGGRRSGQLSPMRRAAMKADCGMSTWPNWRIRFLPSFCFSNSLRFLVTSPP